MRRAARAGMRGLGAVAVIVVLVMLAAISAALVRLSQQSQTATAQQTIGARATAAARAGLQWGLYQAFKGPWTTCSNASQTISDGSSGLLVTVSCDSRTYNEGETSPGVPRTVRVFTIDAVACNGSASCPDAAAAVGSSYVERRSQVQAVD